MTDLIRQSISWPSVHGTRSYSRVTQMTPASTPEPEKTESERRENADSDDAKAGAAPRRGGLLDITA